jgi:hypothetical protein
MANDEDPNRLYLNDSSGSASPHFVERAGRLGIDDANAGMGIAEGDFDGEGSLDLFVSNSRGQTHAVYQRRGSEFADARLVFAGAFGKNYTGWGVSWADLNNDGHLDLALANGEIPVKNLSKDAKAIQVLANVEVGDFVQVGLSKVPRVNGRGVAAADYDNDGDLDVAVNSIGGRLILLQNRGGHGHWLEVKLRRSVPGTVATVRLRTGRVLVRRVHAGSSYLSSEDPRLHFGLGKARNVRELIVRYPSGMTTRLANVSADRLLEIGG